MPLLSLTPELTRKFESACRIPRSETKIVYQIVAVQLRVWLADQNDVACRPWYILCLELYPRGKVINQRPHSPASLHPPPAALCAFLLDHILEPPADEQRVRPTNVTFVNESETTALKPALTKMGLEVGTLSLADGIDEYVRLFSNKLVAMEKATRGDAAERPGLLSAKGVTPEMGTELMKAAVEMYRAQPWKRFPEHIALELQLPSEGDSKYRDRYYVTVLGSDGIVQGFALMPSLSKLRQKYRRAMLRKTDLDPDLLEDEQEAGEGTTVQLNGKGSAEVFGKSAVREVAEDMLPCGACGRRVGEIPADDGTRFVDRCGGCRRLLYCGERCQKLDWRARHWEECQQATADSGYVFKRGEWGWLQREVALLYLDPTAIPFDDLDAGEKHTWDYVRDASPPLYPMPFVTVQNSIAVPSRIERPTAKEFGYLTLIARALTECVSPPPACGTLHLKSGVSMTSAENLAESIQAPI